MKHSNLYQNEASQVSERYYCYNCSVPGLQLSAQLFSLFCGLFLEGAHVCLEDTHIETIDASCVHLYLKIYVF